MSRSISISSAVSLLSCNEYLDVVCSHNFVKDCTDVGLADDVKLNACDPNVSRFIGVYSWK